MPGSESCWKGRAIQGSGKIALHPKIMPLGALESIRFQPPDAWFVVLGDPDRAYLLQAIHFVHCRGEHLLFTERAAPAGMYEHIKAGGLIERKKCPPDQAAILNPQPDVGSPGLLGDVGIEEPPLQVAAMGIISRRAGSSPLRKQVEHGMQVVDPMI